MVGNGYTGRENYHGSRKVERNSRLASPHNSQTSPGLPWIQEFLSMLFIRGFSEIARPLNELLKKDRKFKWTTKCQQAFDNLKTRFTSEPVLVMPDQMKPFQIKCDASKYASGAVLTQLDSNGDRHPCAFISKMFSPAERNYEIYDRELLAIIQALEEWRHYIQGSPHMTIVFSDHKNLTYFWEARKLNRRQA